MTLSRRAQSISPSPTLALTAKARALRAKGIDVIGFGAGEPDFDTPDHIKKEAVKAISEGFTKYTPTSGIPELKEAICKKFKDDNGLDYDPSQVVVSCGAKHSLYNIMQVLCDEGDEVIVPAPYWVSYTEQVNVAGAKPVIIDTKEDTGFKITPKMLGNHISDRTKLLVMNSPSNPTGAVYSRQELEAIARIAVDRKIWVISDEIYEKLIYDDAKHVSIASLGSEIKARTLVVNGVSKTYSMTGWRIGYAAGDKQVIGAISNLQDHSTSNPTSISQRAALAALTSPPEFARQMAQEFKKRRDYMVETVNRIPGLSCIMPKGAFYAFVNISGLMGKAFKEKTVNTSMGLTELLLAEANVVVIPGGPFGADDHIRLSYAVSMDHIVTGLERMHQVIKQMK
ncbi:MAG: pyridoxal phosphate-dependent aminotransferase [Dehalococcoidia bacterium]|nr:pyridoxal phosphate-dependent aminotransferase [Dehalococcoidia bacterium]